MEWNDEINERLRMLWVEGHSTAEIGRRLAVTKNAVVGKAHRMNLLARPSPIHREGAASAVVRPRPPRHVVGSTLPPLPARGEAAIATAGVETPAPAPLPVREEPLAAPAVAAAPASPAAVPPRLAPVPVASPRVRTVACCWPIGDPGTKSFHFCDAAAVPGKPYCTEHAQLAYVKVRDRHYEAA
jgi:GcrA cell cycle regulator